MIAGPGGRIPNMQLGIAALSYCPHFLGFSGCLGLERTGRMPHSIVNYLSFLTLPYLTLDKVRYLISINANSLQHH